MERIETLLSNKREKNERSNLVGISSSMVESFQQTFLDGMSKLGDKLGDIISDGFEKIAKNNEKIDSTLKYGFSDLSSKLDRVNNFVADNSLRSRGDENQLVRFLPVITAELREMVEKIEEHGDMIAAKLTTNKEVANLQEIQEQQTVERLLNAVLSVSSSIDDGNDLVAEAVSTGQDKVSESIDKGREHLVTALIEGHTKIAEGQIRISDTLDKSREDMVNAVTGGQAKISETLAKSREDMVNAVTFGHDKVAESNADIATAIRSVDKTVETAITNARESLDHIKSSVDLQSEQLRSGLDKVSESIDKSREKVSESIDKSREDMVGAFIEGHTKLSERITAGHNKLAESTLAGHNKGGFLHYSKLLITSLIFD